MTPPSAQPRKSSSRLCVLFLSGTCVLLTVVGACLVAALVLLRAHYKNQMFSSQPSTRENSTLLLGNVHKDISLYDVMMGDQGDVSLKNPEFSAPDWTTDFRLPRDTLPLHYDLLLNPDIENGTFSGEVTISIRVIAPRAFLAVNTKRLDIYETSLTLNDDAKNSIHVKGFEYEPNEFWIVQGSSQFEPGLYSLRLKFRGSLQGRIVGFYRSVYKDSKTNTKRKIATSKFQPTYARQAFPCFDEPSFKSNFTVHLVRPTAEYNALSNMDVESEAPNTPSAGLTTVSFTTSVPMVTYLACFIVSDFTSLPLVTVDNAPGASFPFSVYATPAQTTARKTEYALQTGVTVVNYYIEYFDIPYPLPKLDMIAIPDFVSGAMEHWGLITFREANLLFSTDVSSASNQQRVATVVAHELAHMWFGNLMTLKWWDDLWLNEGFASYMEYKGTVVSEPTWNMLDQFLVDDLHPVLKLDAVLSSHPIVQTVGHPDQITELFDTISYNKGAAVIRMLEDLMTASQFQLGIQTFLKEFAFSNAVTQDMWDALQSFAEPGVNITTIMDTWTRQMGFPVVTVKRVGSTDDFELTQDRFLADPNANTTGDESPYGYKWEIPITFITDLAPTAVQADHRAWMKQDDEPVIITMPAGAAWVKFNFAQMGYYRVNYEPAHWNVLNDVLTNSLNTLTVSDRAHLLDDVFSLADANHLVYDIALNMSRYLASELDYVPWNVASSKLTALNSILADSLAYPDLRKYVQKLVTDVYADVSWTIPMDDPHLHRRLRSTVLDLACALGHAECMQEVGQLFTAWIADAALNTPPPDLRSLVYYHGLGSVTTEANWDIMWGRYLAEQDAQEKLKLMYGLAAAKEPWLLRRYIQYAKNVEYVRSQDYFSVLTYISGNPVGNPIVWDFVRSEWEYLVDRFTLNDRYLGRLIPTVTSSFTTEVKLQEMEAFFALYPDAGAGTAARAQALETVENRIKWLERNVDSVRNWLQNEVATE